MILIGISGKARAGKDTLAQYIKELYPNRKVVRVGFADLLKQEITDQVLKPEYSEAVLIDPNTKEFYRPLMQWWGTWRREQDSTYWIKKLEGHINGLESKYGPDVIITITDVRYINEAFWLCKKDGYLVRVNRTWPLLVRIKRFLNPATRSMAKHPSETDLDNCNANYVIKNNGTLLDLKDKVRDMCRTLIV